MTIPAIAGIIALILSLTANIPYVIETIQGKVRPERTSWFIWTLLGVIYFGTAVLEDGAILFTSGELIGPVVILILSLKFGVGGRSKFDLIMLALALVAIVCLLLSQNSLVSLIFALVADTIAFVLTARKLRVDPSSESKWAWGFFLLSGLFAVVSITTWSVETLLFPVYVVLTSTYITFNIRQNKKRASVELEKM